MNKEVVRKLQYLVRRYELAINDNRVFLEAKSKPLLDSDLTLEHIFPVMAMLEKWMAWGPSTGV